MLSRARLLGVGVFALAIMGACALLGAEERPAPGGTYREAVVGQPLSLNPLLDPNDPIARDVAGLVHAGLVRVRDGGHIEGDLASEWKTSADGRTYTFSLRSQAVWHDGRAVTGADVLATVALLQSATDAGQPELAALWRRVRAEAPRPDTVVFHLDEPYASFIEACSLALLPAHVFGTDGRANLREHPASYVPVGAGPYRVQSVDEHGIVLVRHDRYHGARALLDRLELRYFPDLQEAAGALGAGRVDGLAGIAPGDFSRLPDAQRYTLRQVPLQGHQTLLLMNHGNPILAEPAVRRAIAAGLDRTALVDGPLGGQAVAAYGPVAAFSWAYDRGVEMAPDPGQATRLLEETGWTGAPIRARNGRTLRLGLAVAAERRHIALAEAIAAQLGAIGFRVAPQPADPLDLYRERLLPRSYDLALTGIWLGAVDPDPYPLWHSSQREGGLNLSGYADPMADQLLLAARVQGDPGQRFAALGGFQRLWMDQAPSVVLASPMMTYAMANGFRGVRLGIVPEPAARFQHVAEWHVRTQRGPGPLP